MKKSMLVVIICLGILFALVFGYKKFTGMMVQRYMMQHQPVITVSAIHAGEAAWQPQLQASVSIRAILGVNVTTELAGMVQKIAFTPGSLVKKGDLLVELNTDPEKAQLQAYEASTELAKVTYNRDKAQFAIKAVSQATLDTDIANLHQAEASVAQQKAIIAQKTITAPFTGRVGICEVNPGQYIAPGDKITMLQTLDPIYADFFIPQAFINQLKTDQPVTIINSDQNKQLKGKITTINPGLDPSVRNIEVEATINNPEALLTPGMFATAYIDTGKPQSYLTVPISAISFNPFGEIIYILQPQKGSSSLFVASQRFVVTGEKRANQIIVLKGLKKGEYIVTSGQLKLKNNSIVKINNELSPADQSSSNVGSDDEQG